MKIALFLILCSGVAESCLEPHKFNVYDSFYDCMSSGYQESFNKNLQLGPEQVNQYKMYIKFICAAEEEIKI